MNYIPVTEKEKKEMLEVIGKGVEDLFQSIPDDLKLKDNLKLSRPLSEYGIKKKARKLSSMNKNLICFAGGGVYDGYIPSVIDHIISRPEFYTAYTPYQAEVSQGTLQAMYEYQSMICELTGMEISNASIYDGATALAEAVYMALSVKRNKNKIVISEGINPLYLRVIETYLAGNYPVEMVPLSCGITDEGKIKIDDDVACIVMQHPNFLGNLENVKPVVDKAHEEGSLVVMSFDPISLGILKTPGDFDVDIATAEGQPLGIPMSLGGPHLGILTSKKKFVRKVPGRLSGKTEDKEKRTGYVMTLQTREQHIRRARATSNICTNQQLCALMAAVYMASMGKEGIVEVANQAAQKAHYLHEMLIENGFKMPYTGNNKNSFFREFVVNIPEGAKKAVEKGVKEGYLPGINLGKYRDEWKNHLLISVTEKRTKEELDRLVEILSM